MSKKILFICALCLIATGFAAGRNFGSMVDQGYVHERDADVARSGPAPHNGPGRSTGYSFFEKVPGFHYAFRKRVLHPGAAIGYHLQREDEIYYILSGSGIMQMNGKEFPVGPGDAILTRPGSSHGLKQTGDSDLVLMISYEVSKK
ncbi:MAG: cupin domain-containing protein [Acidobacteriota bacterium]|nr:MAG: cupin domain-containing protein [Acidobacteriota bacterium]